MNKPLPLYCPWCRGEKIMAEGLNNRCAMVCQTCLARGPEVSGYAGVARVESPEKIRRSAIRAWNALYYPRHA